MHYRYEQVIALLIMFIGVFIEIFALVFDYEYWNLATLMFLIGVLISDLSAQKYLRKYRVRYGDLK